MNILSLIQNQGPIIAIVFLLSITLAITVHEFAHAWTAYKLGDDTPYLMGRVSLSPLAHLDPLGSLAFLLVGFGWGKPVMYNPLRLKGRMDELLVALAGPASNLVLALLLNLLAFLMQVSGLNLINSEILTLAAYINCLLAAFNLMPIPPLDGSSIIAYFFPGYRNVLAGQLGFIVLLAVMFVPIGNSSLLSILINPLIYAFSWLSQLGGLI